MNIEIYGGSGRLRAAARILSLDEGLSCGKLSDLRLLPVPSMRDGVHITGTETELADFAATLGKESFVAGYGIPEDARAAFSERGAFVFDAAKDEAYQLENAYVSALGAFRYVLDTEKRSPDGMSFGVVGYGRIGRALARMLLFFGARLRIFTSKPLNRIDLGEFGVDTSDISVTGFDFSDVGGLDIILNTAPADFSAAFPKHSLPEGLRVIDLASGDSFPGVAGVEYLPSIPERMFPESAGAALARAIARAIKREAEL